MILFDSGAWIALSVPNDRNAKVAQGVYADTARGVHGRIVTTDFVLDEAATFVRMATDVATAAVLLRRVTGAPNVTVVWIDARHFADAIGDFERHQDKRWSFTDCTSFVVMRDLGIEKAFTFDRNFDQAGFTRLP
ncbi:MAG: type II toxin-antitoxin system VapC family toxin [Methanobacteriota archaeon]|nr:MAG: type II toxin-antitoxin system VapC family toxin [Euryarchaeota archaeon]